MGLPGEGDANWDLGDPKLPSQDEVEYHYVAGHLPYRSWCPICVRAHGRDMDHCRDTGDDSVVYRGGGGGVGVGGRRRRRRRRGSDEEQNLTTPL